MRSLRFLAVVLGSLAVGTGVLTAADVSTRPMVWAHYVAWLQPIDSSFNAQSYYNYPLFRSTGNAGNDWAEEIRQAKAQGIDGFFVDIVFKPGAPSNYVAETASLLAAAEGQDFQVGICLDVKTTVENQVSELSSILTQLANHPNYPKYGNKPVVATYTWGEWTPAEWAAIRQGVAAAGHDIYLIANVNRNYDKQTTQWLQSYAPYFDMAYAFNFHGIDGVSRQTTANMDAQVAEQNGKAYMAGGSPGYYGAWLNGRNDYYQPFRGFDQLHECFYTIVRPGQDKWMHFTTWNDHDESSILPMLFTTANPLITKAYSDAFKGNTPTAPRPEICFAYHREELTGTLLRIEAMALPAQPNGTVTVKGHLLDQTGARVVTLEPRSLDSAQFGRTEWLVPTANLAYASLLTPEITVTGNSGYKHTAQLPAVRLVNGWLQNAVTVKVPLTRYQNIFNTLAVESPEPNTVAAKVSFASPQKVLSATLFQNDRPIASFAAETQGKKLVTLYVESSGTSTWTASIKNGQFIRGVRKLTANGLTEFRVTSTSVSSSNMKDWKPAGVLCSIGPTTEITFNGSWKLTPQQLIEGGAQQNGQLTVSIAQVDTSVQMHPLINKNRGDYSLSVVLPRASQPGDLFFVRYDLEGGQVAVSKSIFPFAAKCEAQSAKVVQTNITLETPTSASSSGGTGMPGENPYLTPAGSVPFGTPTLVDTRIPYETIRMGRWTFDNGGADSLGDMPVMIPSSQLVTRGTGKALKLDASNPPVKMRLRTWPMGSATVDFLLNPTSAANQSILSRDGWSDGLNINFTSQRRIQVVRDWARKTSSQRTTLTSSGALTLGQWTRVRVTFDGQTIRIYLNGQLSGSTNSTVSRSYGNSTWYIGQGSSANFTGQIDELTVCGAAFAPDDPAFPGQD